MLEEKPNQISINNKQKKSNEHISYKEIVI